ncbi:MULTISPECIES: ComEC/Rec2 family competence protein [unclassified Leptolyngbya]|uniref:ComEC/Rec2 family competence protein n=1 Tax=unclassified Leptolyngbya TaxID=2650499 RepID=UPI001687801F|nr:MULTISPECIES: ComEC/Rec2 family competence protein [unclassified Leptolyngbya]MBD1912303.1 ComEC/Rec2 family competence protein [Leptolyngbya sp. FACHB-8]MBD2156295.1 ComEC/Rec2 family competence protein [Leptolyngbya sp. FACHB-16]
MSTSGLVLCCAYVVGLLLTALPWKVSGVPVGAIALLMPGIVTALVMPRVWRIGPRAKVWLVAGAIGGFAAFYLGFRTPAPGAADVSHWLERSSLPSQVEVWGFIETSPRLTRSQKIQFNLDVFQIGGSVKPSEPMVLPEAATGHVYVTVPLLWGTGLHPGQMVSVKGKLYEPQAATNPGGFDFRAQLAQQGIFAGLNGKLVTFPEPEGRFREQRTLWRQISGEVQRGLWEVRGRIVRSHVSGLSVPEGPLVSAMLLGKGGVDVSFAIKDAFASVGLAHALAASGFQVSLLVGIMVRLTQGLEKRLRLGVCTGALVVYIGLTGLEASVLRAGVMGFAVLLAMTLERRSRPLGSLLVAAVLLLVFNPLWIWDLGFQLSFMATLALLIMGPALMKQLDWMPTGIASLVAVPLAAYIWTLPLQLYVFGVVSPYSVLLNVVVAPVLTVISLGSAIAGLFGFFYIPAGSLASMLLYFPTHWLIQLSDWVSKLPGNGYATGTISIEQVLALYGLYLMIWWVVRLQRYWWIVTVLCVGLVAVPAGAATTQRFQATVLATSDHPVMVLQKKGEVGIIGTVGERDAQFAVLPFLQKQGVNEVDWAIAPHWPTESAESAGWLKLLDRVSIHQLYTLPDSQKPSSPVSAKHQRIDQVIPLPLGKAIPVGSTPIRLVSAEPAALRFQLGDQIWLFVDEMAADRVKPMIAAGVFSAANVVWWGGELRDKKVLEQVGAEVAIASGNPIFPELEQWFQQHQTAAYSTQQDGAIQWTVDTGFSHLLSADSE